jgi:hypothetical protein
MILLNSFKECFDVGLDLEGELHHHVFDLPYPTETLRGSQERRGKEDLNLAQQRFHSFE